MAWPAKSSRSENPPGPFGVHGPGKWTCARTTRTCARTQCATPFPKSGRSERGLESFHKLKMDLCKELCLTTFPGPFDIYALFPSPFGVNGP
eukprot:4008167-Lingulodinium_polyedra.AAC.1